MSGLVPLDDPADHRLADYVRLREVSLRRLLEEEHGLFIAEGDKVIRRAADAGYEPRSFLLAPRWLDSLADVLAKWPDAPVYVVSEELAEQVTGFHVHRGALASYKRRAVTPLSELLADDVCRIAIFDDIVDHTNVGAGFRAAAAMGVELVLVTPTCAEGGPRRTHSDGRRSRLPERGVLGSRRLLRNAPLNQVAGVSSWWSSWSTIGETGQSEG